MNQNRIIPSIYMAFAVLYFAACSGPDQSMMGGFSMPPTPVEVAMVTSQTVIDKFDAVGTIEAEQAITLVSEIDAAVVSLPFIEGTAIERGDLIAQLDGSQLAAEVARYEALLAQSQVSYNRIKEVVEQKAGAPQDLDDAEAALQVAEANLALAKARFDKTRILAPFPGTVGARRVSVGSFLRAGQAIADLVRINEIRVIFSAPERYLGQLKRGASVDVTTTAYPNYALQGKIIVVEPVLDSATRNARIVARMQNPEGKFRPGMSANVTAVLNERSNALTIPSEAVFASGDQSFAFVVGQDSTVMQVPLILGTRLATAVEVLDGVQEGMQVVRAGHQKIYHGAKVMPVSSQQNSGAPPQQQK